MRFIKEPDADKADQYLLSALVRYLDDNKRVTWFLSGGSNIDISVRVLNQLPTDNINSLTVILGDERYGEFGNPDSNTQKLAIAGFNFDKVRYIPILQKDNPNLAKTTGIYARIVEEQLASSDITVGQFGIGADGHTAGILPKSQACYVKDDFVTSYFATDFERITLTFDGIRQLSDIYVFAFGEDKKQPLQLLHDQDLSLPEQPAQVFKKIDKSTIINDMIGDEL